MEKSLCQTSLKTIFPSLWERNELLYEIRRSSSLSSVFESWTDEQQTEFLDFCTGVRGIKLSDNAVLEQVYFIGRTPVITYKKKEIQLNRLKIAKRDGKGTKTRL